MATGDSSDMLVRLRANLPPWFPAQGGAPVLDGVLTGIATTLAFVYSLYAYAKLQTRLKTLTGAFIDIAAFDFFGTNLIRAPGESDTAYDARFVAAITQAKLTPPAILTAIQQFTGYPARLIEPFAVSDTGYWKTRGSGSALSAYNFDTPSNPARWSSRGLRCQFFIECALPPILAGLAMPAYGSRGSGDGVYGAYFVGRGGVGASTIGAPFISRGDVPANRGEAAVYKLLNSLRAAGVICWVKFVPVPTALTWDQPGATWDSNRSWD